VTYSQFGLYIPGVEYVKKDGEVEKGTYVPIVIAASSGRENAVQTHAEKEILNTEVDITRSEDSYRIGLGYEGVRWADFKIGNFKEISQEDNDQPANEGLLCHRYGNDEGKNDTVGYPVWISGPEETVEKILIAEDVDYHIDDLASSGNTSSPLRAITQRLKEIPVFKVLEAKLVQGTGTGNVNAQRRIE
jgi:hypothetical protein